MIEENKDFKAQDELANVLTAFKGSPFYEPIRQIIEREIRVCWLAFLNDSFKKSETLATVAASARAYYRILDKIDEEIIKRDVWVAQQQETLRREREAMGENLSRMYGHGRG